MPEEKYTTTDAPRFMNESERASEVESLSMIALS